MNDPNILSWHTPRRMKVWSLTSATMRATSVPGSYPAHPSSPGQHHAWFPLNQEMCFDFALIFQVSPTFMPAGKHAAGPVEWLEGHVLTMCLRVTFQALRDGFSPWQHHLLLILPPSGKDIRSWNLIWFFFFYLGMSEPSFSAPFFKWPDVHWFQVSSLFLDLASEKKILQGMHWVMFSPCIMHVQTIFSS